MQLNHSYLLPSIQLFLNLLQSNKEIEVGNQFTEQPLFEVNVLDSSDTKERLDRFEKYAKNNAISLEEFD